ncbi:hypothetical protein K5F93_18700 [Pseudomonas protegens]|uniref:hypothetical protein n=1 Tax=Pseudomonas protegens TaxID=380021 RepID=UPI001C8EEC3B|nr:hypothetical protein [Pseudomonas protegens]QZI68435.1 hypothetical protein K5F93_18700 [Pseudomonas protegens]
MSDADKGKKEPGKSEGGSGLTSIFNLIPSVYYDLIARICPGMAFWIVLAFKYPLLPGVEPQSVPEMLTGTLLIVLIILSYVSGIVFTGFAVLWDLLSIALLASNQNMKQLLGLDGETSTSFTRQWKHLSKRIDQVIKEDEGAGKTLVKAMAEVTLCQNLLTGLIALITIELCYKTPIFLPIAQYKLLYLGISIALITSMLFRQAMFLGRVKDLHELYIKGREV